MNKVVVVGKAFKKGDLAESKSGVKYQHLRILDSQPKKEESFYFECVAFGKTAELIDKVVENGRDVVIWGDLKEDKNTKKMSVNINSFTMVGYKNPSEPKEEKPVEQEDIF